VPETAVSGTAPLVAWRRASTADTITVVDTDERSEALRHDLEGLEHAAEETAERVAKRAAPYLVGFVVLVVLAWVAGRKLRDRAERRR